jgi:sulfhydrogenase subunit beta (sulfur reductase)
LDEIYLDKDFPDPFYRKKRSHTLLISFDCFGIQEHCHCTTYGVKPYSVANGDLSVALIDDKILMTVISSKGASFWEKFKSPHKNHPHGKGLLKILEGKREETIRLMNEKHGDLPDYEQTGRLVQAAGEAIWKKYAARCVSCGACTTICPTCSCFLLIDKPGFEKVKQLDACQYPGFERVAGGEDSLYRLHNRFRNRYMCKYVWKPEKFSSIACTGCGRCIEACIGNINKNELFMEFKG